MSDAPPPRLFALVIVVAAVVAVVSWFELRGVPDTAATTATGSAKGDDGDRGPAATPPRAGAGDLPAEGRDADGPGGVDATRAGAEEPALVDGKPGVPPPEDLASRFAELGDGGDRDPGDGLDPDRNRNPNPWGPDSVIPPHVEDRPLGVPPTPQGAGENAREVWSGEAEDFDDDPRDPALIEAEISAAVRGQLGNMAGCFSGGRVPNLAVRVESQRDDDGMRTGYVGFVDRADGVAMGEPVEDCVMLFLDDLVLAAYPGARRGTVFVPGSGG